MKPIKRKNHQFLGLQYYSVGVHKEDHYHYHWNSWNCNVVGKTLLLCGNCKVHNTREIIEVIKYYFLTNLYQQLEDWRFSSNGILIIATNEYFEELPEGFTLVRYACSRNVEL